MGEARAATRRWTRVEYDRLIEAGFFRPGDRVELLGGGLIVAEPQGTRLFTAIRAVESALRACFGPGWEVRTQGPVADGAAPFRWRYRSAVVLRPRAVREPPGHPACGRGGGRPAAAAGLVPSDSLPGDLLTIEAAPHGP